MYAFDPLLFRAPMIAYMERRGPGCFDFAYYMENSPETLSWPAEEVWAHFVQSGQFEQRLYRYWLPQWKLMSNQNSLNEIFGDNCAVCYFLSLLT